MLSCNGDFFYLELGHSTKSIAGAQNFILRFSCQVVLGRKMPHKIVRKDCVDFKLERKISREDLTFTRRIGDSWPKGQGAEVVGRRGYVDPRDT